MTYEEVTQFSETWGLIYLFIMFVGVITFAFWPSNKARFDDAAQVPFRDGETDDTPEVPKTSKPNTTEEGNARG